MEKDLVDYTYLSDNLRYADLFNGVLFGGEEVISADHLTGDDTKLVIPSKGKKKGRYRDIVRKYENGVSYAVLGVENQEAVDYTMPLRIMEYEAGEYSRQVAEIKKLHERLEDVTGDEYLCKFSKTDKIWPCITLVLYWGEKWDGSKTLWEMMRLEDLPEALRTYVNDYPTHLVNVKGFENTSVFKSDLRLVFDFLKHAKDREGMRKLLLENEAYRTVSRDAYEVMRVHTNLAELDKYMEEKVDEEKEDLDMCQAIRELIEDGRQEGKLEGRLEGKKEGRMEALKLSVENLMKSLSISLDKACELLDINEECDKLKQMID